MAKKLTGKKRKIPPFRYDIVGSFLRSDSIKTARAQYRSGKITASQLADIEDIEIAKLVEKQKELGLKAVTDGELRRSWWHLDFFLEIEGTQKIRLDRQIDLQGIGTKPETFKIVGKIRFKNHPMVEHFRYLKNIAGKYVPKFTIPSPALFHFVQSSNKNHVYKHNEDLLNDIIAVYKDAIKAFYDAGCRYLQFDDTSWGTLCSKRHRDYFKTKGIDPDLLANDYVRLINESIADRPSDMTVVLHICRGNLRSTWFASGGYDPIAQILFPNARIDGFFLEFDDERSGDFKPLQFIRDQIVVLGLVSTKHGGLENKEKLKARIAEAARYVSIEKLCLSPQCGFASTEEGNMLTEEEQWDKVRLVIETASEIWIR